MRLDDDVHVTGNKSDCSAFLSRALSILREDESILGMNLISMIPGKHGDDWMPGEGYSGDPDFPHPKKYFGTAGLDHSAGTTSQSTDDPNPKLGRRPTR